MVQLTEDAGRLLRRIQEGQANARTLRMVAEAGDLVLGTSDGGDGDEVLFYQGTPVLSLSPEAASTLSGYAIGIEQTDQGPTLQVIPQDGSAQAP